MTAMTTLNPIDPDDPLTWGIKRRCINAKCGVLFYDRFATQLTCPSCAKTFPVEETLKLRPSRQWSRNDGAKTEDELDASEEAIDDQIDETMPDDSDDIDSVLSENDSPA